jgi:K+/H+ antiporter YhaU regulatory subunit KhtT
LNKKDVVPTPKYQQIAADIAAKIVDKHYKIGDKIYARSSLASQYGVSSETARRAICILSDLKIVESVKGSGIRIISYENAFDFVRNYKDIQSVKDIKREILKTTENLMNTYKELNKLVSALIERTGKFKSINPFVPFEIIIDDSALHIGKTLSEINFWHNTSATVVGVKHNNQLYMSPGPYFVIDKGDTLYFVGDENCNERVRHYLYG